MSTLEGQIQKLQATLDAILEQHRRLVAKLEDPKAREDLGRAAEYLGVMALDEEKRRDTLRGLAEALEKRGADSRGEREAEAKHEALRGDVAALSRRLRIAATREG